MISPGRENGGNRDTIYAGCTDLLDLGGESIEVDKQIDPCVREGRHASFVVGRGIHVVHTNGVGAQLGHASDVALALRGVDERIVGSELIGDAYAGLVRSEVKAGTRAYP